MVTQQKSINLVKMLGFVLSQRTVVQDRFEPEVIMHLIHAIFLIRLYLLSEQTENFIYRSNGK